MTRVICLLNLKGGVGKTTTTVALAETLAVEHRKRVLVIDLDPQTNATMMLIGETRWNKLDKAELTLHALFKSALERNCEAFDFDRIVTESVSDVQGAERIDLLPSSLKLMLTQDELLRAPLGSFAGTAPHDILRRALRSRLQTYDYVLIDCPPDLGVITWNGLRIADGFIILTVPDFLSTYGINPILTRVRENGRRIGEPPTPFGILLTKFQDNSSVHKTTEERLRTDYRTGRLGAPVFATVMRQANQIAKAAEYQSGKRRTLRQKYETQGQIDMLRALAGEVIERTEITR